MDQTLATLIAGLGGAIIAGGIGLVSVILTHRASQRQLERQALENDINRKHDVLRNLQPKQIGAIETVWKLLFKLEQNWTLTDDELNNFICATMWIRSTARAKILQILITHNRRSKMTTNFIAKIKCLREELLKESGISGISTLLNHKNEGGST